MTGRSIRRPLLCAGLTAAVTAAGVGEASAAVTATRSAKKVAGAIVNKPSLLRGARWITLPPRGKPAAISTTSLVGFPRAGRRFAVLSTGDATAITAPNAEEDLSSDNAGKVYRGTRDAVVLRLDLRVPRRSTCLSVKFRFLSEEFDEFVDTDFNDGFLAELGRTTWRSGADDPAISAPRNFAFDRERTPITVNGTGDFSVTAQRARGTTYDGATRRLRASKRLKPGLQRVYLSLFDQGDHQYDSSVVLDGLTLNTRRPCVSGAALD